MRDILAMGARPGRGDGRAALRRRRRRPTPRGCCPGWSPASAATATAWACPTSAARSVFDPSYAGNPLVNALCVGVLPAARMQTSAATGAGQPGRAVRRQDRRRRHRRGLGPGQRDLRRDGGPRQPARPCRSVTRSPRRSLIECCPRAVRRGPGRRHPGPRRGRALLRDVRDWPRRPAPAACTSSWTGCRCATPTLAPEEILMSESQERMWPSSSRSGSRTFLAICRALGRPGDRHRRGDRHRPARHRAGTARRVVDVPPRSRSPTTGPSTSGPSARPTGQDALQADAAASRPAGPSCGELLLRLIG